MPPISEPPTPEAEPLDIPPHWINAGEMPQWLDIARVIEIYSEKSGGRVRFVGHIGLQTRSNAPDVAFYPVFWQEKLIDPEHSHYFALLRADGEVYIRSAAICETQIWNGVMHPETGEVIFSRSNWDYRATRDCSIAIDAGPHGFVKKGRGILVRIRLVDGIFKVFDIQKGYVEIKLRY